MKLKLYTIDSAAGNCASRPGSSFSLCSRLVAIISFSLLSVNVAEACGGFICDVSDLDFYRIMPYGEELKTQDFAEQNCILWARQVGGKVDVDAVREAVYGLSSDDWAAIRSLCRGNKHVKRNKLWRRNGFVRRLIATHDTTAADLLYWSKLYERRSEEERSPWIYRPTQCDFSAIADSALAYNRSRYASRYMLLCSKLLFKSQRYADCVALWNRRGGKVSHDMLYEKVTGYVAGSMAKLGSVEEACRIYAAIGDLESLQEMKKFDKNPYCVLYDYDPNSPFIPALVQEFFFRLENPMTRVEYYSEEEKQYHDKVLQELKTLASEACSNPKVDNKAMWRYVMAALLDYEQRPQEALRYVEGVRSQDAFLDRSLHIMRIYLHAQTDTLDAAYEERLYEDLQWLDSCMMDEWNALQPSRSFALSHINELRTSCRRTIYTYDALRKIMVGNRGLCNRLLEEGDAVRAIQLANMAENYLFKFTDNPVVRRLRNRGTVGRFYFYASLEDVPDRLYVVYYKFSWKSVFHDRTVQRFNEHDYSNEMFEMVESIDAKSILDYWNRVEQPADSFDAFLNNRSYLNADYWREIAATHCMREQRWAKAVELLSKVKESYFKRMNVYCYFDYDPLNFDNVRIDSRKHYKLDFASAMLQLEKEMRSKDANVAALAQVDYSIGLENMAVNCWALVEYSHSNYYFWDDESDDDWMKNRKYYVAHRLKDEALRLRAEALDRFTDDEYEAQALLKLCQFSKVVLEFSGTKTAAEIVRRCDYWRDYFNSKEYDIHHNERDAHENNRM